MKWALPLVLAGCSAAPSVMDASVFVDASVVEVDAGVSDAGIDAGLPPWAFEFIRTDAVMVGTGAVVVDLVRAHRPDGARTYLLYIHAAVNVGDGGVPVVIVNAPYDGIDWSGDPDDAKWVARDAGSYLDEDGPQYDGGGVVGWSVKSIKQTVDESTVHLLNGMAVVHAYGRFYEGGSIEDDIRDAEAPFHFVLTRNELDLTRVGNTGSSWGGFMSVFGSSRAPAGLRLEAVVALTPPSDMADMFEWATVRGPVLFHPPEALSAFYQPYVRRMNAATQWKTPAEAPMLWAPYRAEAVCEGFRTRHPEVQIVVGHDQWDSLVPVTETERLAEVCPELVLPLYWPRNGVNPYTELDHGPFIAEPTLPVMFTLTYLHLALKLTHETDQALTAAVPAALDSYLSLLKDSKARGERTAYAVVPLQLMTEPRAACFDGVNTIPCRQVISESFNRVFSATTTIATIREALATQFGP